MHRLHAPSRLGPTPPGATAARGAAARPSSTPDPAVSADPGHRFDRIRIAAARRTGRPPGRAIPTELRREMESRLGGDFSAVRLHEDPASDLAGADAFTAGEHIHLAPGRVRLATSEGRRLLAHELAHVVQGRTGRIRGPVGSADPRRRGLEREAEAVGAAVVAGRSAALGGAGAEARPGAAVPQNVLFRKTIVNGQIVDVPDDAPPRPHVPFAGTGFRLGDGQPVQHQQPVQPPQVQHQQQVQGPQLEQFPDEVLQHIGSYLPMGDRGRLAQTSSRMNTNVADLNRRDRQAQLALVDANQQGRVPQDVWDRLSLQMGLFTLGSESDDDEKGP